MTLIAILITLLYLALIGSLIIGFDKIDSFLLQDIPAKTKFSIIIPFRNEAENLPKLLHSISKLNYPKTKFEIIFVDDTSEDTSLEILQRFLKKEGTNCSIISNKRTSYSPKKDAITLAIQHSKYDWIVTTDADCCLPKYWLDSFDVFIQKTNSDFISAPVTYKNPQNFLERFQLLDVLSLQAATIGGFGIKRPFLCNGANLVYKKSLFKLLNGFEGNSNIASGDDIFLLEKALKNNTLKVQYLKCEHAIVSTQPQTNFKDLVSQRVRWAAKTRTYKNGFGKFTGIVILLMNVLLISGILLCFVDILKWQVLFYLAIIKLSVDVLLIYKSASFFDQKEALRSYIFGFLIYPFFSVYIVFLSFFKGYKWKGRPFNK